LQGISNDELPLCVGILGNGLRLWAHYTALARVVEDFGLIHGVAGGSSATITSWLLEGMLANPNVKDCEGGGRQCTDMEQRARLSLLLKTVQALPDDTSLVPLRALDSLSSDISDEKILERLTSGNRWTRTRAVADLLALLRASATTLINPAMSLTSTVFSLINEDFLTLLTEFPGPVYHATDICRHRLVPPLTFQLTHLSLFGLTWVAFLFYSVSWLITVTL